VFFDNRKILLLIVILTLALIPFVIFTEGILRMVLGVFMVIFSPGYSLLSALYPRKGDLSATERIALSFGLSLAIVPLLGLILNYTPLGIKIIPVLITIVIFIVITSAIGWYRHQRMSADNRFGISLSSPGRGWSAMDGITKMLTIVLVIVIVGAIGVVSYIMVTPREGEKFTEFYILGPGGEAKDYPTAANLGEPVDVIIGIINHEQETTSYRIVISIGTAELKEINIQPLENDEKWEEQVSFIPEEAGNEQRIDFHLFKNNEEAPNFEDPLYIFLDILNP
jgi:uncharacterized membrane protein